MTAMTWQQRIDAARTEADVVAATCEFLASFTPSELNRLPAPCQPPLRIREREDISAYAYDLVRHQCAAGDEQELVQKLARFFGHASTRLAHISSRKYTQHGHIRPDDDKGLA